MSFKVSQKPQPPGPMEIMAKERSYCPFDKRALTYAFHGDKRTAELKEKFMVELSRNLNFKIDDIHDLSKDQLRERTMAKFGDMVYWIQNEPLDDFQKRMEVISLIDPSFYTRFGVHYGLFLGAIRSNATANQFSYWLDKGVIGLNGMVGCFGMTELTHGSNVAGLQTTATWDERSDEFVINTPNIGATKWWIGGAAHTATHCAVFARLIIRGQDHGVKTFITPLRDPKTYRLYPGVTIGDIGKKMGRDGIDNGWIMFTNVRIPRSYMLMKYTQVTSDGTVHAPPMQQLTYGALLQGRTAMVADAANVSKKALTIAIRYGVVRRQFKTGNNPFETQILDYPIHQRRLMPLLAQSIAMGFTAMETTKLFEALTNELETFDITADEEKAKEVFQKLAEVHGTSAGLKAFSTWNSLKIIDECRQACGGHGYSAYAGFSNMYADQAVQALWEGDGTILSLQAGRALVSSYGAAMKGLPVPSGVSYLSNIEVALSAKCPAGASIEDITSIDTIASAWDSVSAHAVKRAAEAFANFRRAGLHKDEAFEKCSQERFIAAKIHTSGYTFRTFKRVVDGMAEKPVERVGEGVHETMKTFCRLFGLWSVEENAGEFLKYGFFGREEMDVISRMVTELCAEVRKYTIAVTDAFGFSDHLLNSPLGKYNGDIYTAYFNQVRAANPTPPEHPYFERLIKPLIHRPPVELDENIDMDLDEELKELLEVDKEDEVVKGEKGRDQTAETLKGDK